MNCFIYERTQLREKNIQYLLLFLIYFNNQQKNVRIKAT